MIDVSKIKSSNQNMEITSKLIIEWGLLLAGLVALIYTMMVVKKEKFVYQESATPLCFHGYTLLIPNWWSKEDIKDQNKKVETPQITFKRSDTYYDWRASYQFIEDDQLFDQSIEEVFRDIIEKQEIQFDANEAIIHEPAKLKQYTDFNKEDFDIVRLEGMGTQHQSERIYLDAFLIRNHKSKNHLYGQSHSSVLNGMLEGPYFEQVLYKAIENLSKKELN